MEKDKTIIDYGRIIYSRRWIIVILMVAIVGFTAINSFFTEKGYTATAIIFPTTTDQGGIVSFTSNLLGGLVKQDANVLVVLFKSRNMAERVALKLKLEDYFLSDSERKRNINGIWRAISVLDNKTNAAVSKDNAIELSVSLNDPELAKNVLEAYIGSVSEYLNKNSVPINFIVIDPPRASPNPSSPNTKLNLITALIVALVLGISFSLLDEYFRLVLKQ